MADVLLSVDGINVSYKGAYRARRVLRGVRLTCGSGEITSVIGRSGVGKTTLLKAIAGLVPLERGRIIVEGQQIRGPGPDRSLVFQDYPVFPWLTVVENVEIGIRFGTARVDDGQSMARAKELLEGVGLMAWAHEYPDVLSGGMRQRVALARSLGSAPKVLLLDEPFGALDAVTRVEIQELVRKIHARREQAMVLVTHDIAEAVLLSDKVCVLGVVGDEGEASICGEWLLEEPRRHVRPEDLGKAERTTVGAVRKALGEQAEERLRGDSMGSGSIA